mmetsp:Transcript_25887/g.37102  ORF Transcript_25887/g.37102 Transcript_25887/m.37102 type:complete len:208 (-) Transcript_25887:822-1445(-)
MLHYLNETVLKFSCTIYLTPNTRLGSSKEAGKKVNASLRQLAASFGWNFEALSPSENFTTSSNWILGIKWCIADETFVHDNSQTPPIDCTSVRISRGTVLRSKNFRSNVIRSTNSRICHLSTRLACWHLLLDIAAVIVVGCTKSSRGTIDRHAHGISRTSMHCRRGISLRMRPRCGPVHLHSTICVRSNNNTLLAKHFKDNLRMICG